ncbi:MAG: DNA primase [Elusimicrobia bacterium]|nr:DNA primase [Elusimicrobiota bacterium]
MANHNEEWKVYKAEILSRIQDFSDVFTNLKKQRPTGEDWIAACCPLHDDHNPSFAYNKKTGQWACFAKCGKGSAFDFLMHSTGASFKEVLFRLGDKAGVPRPGGITAAPSDRIDEQYPRQLAETLQANLSALRYLKEKRGLTDETIKKYGLGWDNVRRRVSIPVRDERGRLVNIRLYSSLKTPKMINLKGHGTTPRLYGADELLKHEGKQVLLCEGELDRLLLQQQGFMAVTSTHGCSSFRGEWIPLFKDKHVVVVYDCDSEGQASVEAIVLKAFKESKVASIKNIRLPLLGSKDDKDVTDFFTKPRQMGGGLFDKRCYTAKELQDLIDKTSALNLSGFVPGLNGTNEKGIKLSDIIDSIRNAEDKKSHERQVEIAEATAGHLGRRGAFFFDPKSSEEFLCLDSHVFTVGNNRNFNALLQDLAHFNVTNSEGRFLWEYLRNHARRRGTPIRSTSWIYGDTNGPVLFIHTHDHDGRILKISPRSVTEIPNGQNDDNILLNPSDRVQPFRYLEKQDLGENLQLLKAFVYDSAPCSEPDKAFLLAYTIVVLLRDFCFMKPLLRLSGVHGSGKSSITSTMSYVLYGENVGKLSTVAANFTDGSKNPLTILDNKEVRDIDKDLLNFLLTSSTGIVHEKRKLYENQEIIRERANCFILTNGIESLGKPELISRQWEIQCDQAFFNPDFSVSDHISRLRGARDKIFTAMIDLIAYELLPRFSQRKDLEINLSKAFRDHPKSRTFECLSLILLVWDVLEALIGLPDGLDEQWLEAQHVSSEEASQETNVFLPFLDLIQKSPTVLRDINLQDALPGHRAYFEVTSLDLHTLFSRLARENGLPPPFVNARQLGERLSEAVPVLKKVGWDVQLRARTVRGRRFHKFQLPVERTNLTQIQGATL